MERSSKEVKITIVLDNGKTTRLSEGKKERSVTVTHDSSMTLMSTLLKNGLLEEASAAEEEIAADVAYNS